MGGNNLNLSLWILLLQSKGDRLNLVLVIENEGAGLICPLTIEVIEVPEIEVAIGNYVKRRCVWHWIEWDTTVLKKVTTAIRRGRGAD